jgi:deoxycytidylate deaminase
VMNSILKRAVKEACKSSSTFLVGAVVHCKGRILSSGHNKANKTHPSAETNGRNVRIHAEHSALIGVQHYERGNLEVTVVRIRRMDGSFAISKPCSNCMRLMEEAGIKKIHYTDNDGNLITIDRNTSIISDSMIEFAKNEWENKQW